MCVVSEEMHRVCPESQAAAEVHPKGRLPAQGLVARHIPGIRVSHICAHSYQHTDASNEGKHTLGLFYSSMLTFVIFR